MGKPRAKTKCRIVLPEDPTSLELGDVDRWLSEHDDRTVVERLQTLWYFATPEDKSFVRHWQ